MTANIRRKRFFDIPKIRFPDVGKLPETFMHPIGLLSNVHKQQSCCEDSWAVATVSCLSDLYGIRDGKNPDLDYAFVMSCYAPKNFSKYYTSWGCNGDSPYNAIYFLYINGTTTNTCWNSNLEESDVCKTNEVQGTCSRVSINCKDAQIYKLGESDLPGKNPDAFNVCPILTSDNKLIWADGNIIDPNKARDYLRYLIQRGPIVTCFPYLESFKDMSSTDWDPTTGIYTPHTGSITKSITGTHCAVIVGWGPGYWILRNSWGTDWGPKYKDLPPGYWKHATYSPKTALGSVDISLAPDHPLIRENTIMTGNKTDPIGTVISLGISSTDISQILDISKLSYAPYLRDSQDTYPTYLWVTLFVIIVLLSAKVLVC